MVDGMDTYLPSLAWIATIGCFMLLLDSLSLSQKRVELDFFYQLHKATGEPPLLEICSDACKGLTFAVKEVFPKWILQ
jgi:hypothetical protein